MISHLFAALLFPFLAAAFIPSGESILQGLQRNDGPFFDRTGVSFRTVGDSSTARTFTPNNRFNLSTAKKDVKKNDFMVTRLPGITDNASIMRKLNGIYAGQIPIKSDGSSLFFTYFPAPASIKSNDLVIWLNGGPGCSSMLGLFLENSPVRIQENGTIAYNPYSWHTISNLLYVDQPIGVGYSFFAAQGSAVYNSTAAANDMYAFIAKFFDIFKETQSMNLYITGQSYAGQYVPSIADNFIFKNRLTLPNRKKLNLKGIAVGNGVLDDNQSLLSPPTYFLNEADFWRDVGRQLGLFSPAVQQVLDEVTKQCIAKYNAFDENEEYPLADEYDCSLYLAYVLLSSELDNVPILEACRDPYNLRKPCFDTTLEDQLETYLQRTDVREGLNLNPYTPAWTQCSKDISDGWNETGVPTPAEIYPKILARKDIRVFIYQGMIDNVVNYVYVERGLGNMTWNGATGFKQDYASTKNNWIVDGKVAGTTVLDRGLRYYRVYDSGHYVPTDTPAAALDILRRLIGAKAPGTPRRKRRQVI
ncbi:Alpha/Beta hydrolase protein [Cladochytrium replicatum]|nr:Alpha/Beta hydrolase protein [Cladochytrium replicatum]